MDQRHRPGLYSAPDAKLMVVFVHGFLGGPGQFEPLVQAVNAAGFDAQTLLLPGHGGRVWDFARHSGQDWQQAVDDALRVAPAHYEKVVLMGHSLGGLLSVNAWLRAGPANGLVLWETPLRLRLRVRGFTNDLAVAFLPRRLQNPVARAYGVASNVRITTPLGYLLTIPRAAELLRIMAATEQKLPRIKGPVLLIQSQGDEIVHPSSLGRLQKGLENAEVTSLSLNASWHSYFPDDEFSLLCDRFVAWLKTI